MFPHFPEKPVNTFVALTSAFIVSACIASIPDALPIFMALMAVLTFNWIGGIVSISTKSSDGGELVEPTLKITPFL